MQAKKLYRYGWLLNVVDPLNFAVQGYHSSEAQAFVMLMQAVSASL